MACASVIVVIAPLRGDNDGLSVFVAIAGRLTLASQSISVRIVDLLVSTCIFSARLDLRMPFLRATYSAAAARRRTAARTPGPIGLPGHARHVASGHTISAVVAVEAVARSALGADACRRVAAIV